MPTTLQINNFIPITTVEGPGKRACIWVQGCKNTCPGCFSPNTWPIDGGKSIQINNLYDKIMELSPKIEGVTFSGGEPFLQAEQLFALGKKIKENSNLSIITFTGYEYNQLINANNDNWNKLLSLTDILIDGPYVKDLPSKISLKGSENQKIHFLTSRYLEKKDEIQKESKKIEFHIRPDSTVIINGNVSDDVLKNLNGWIIKKN